MDINVKINSIISLFTLALNIFYLRTYFIYSNSQIQKRSSFTYQFKFIFMIVFGSLEKILKQILLIFVICHTVFEHFYSNIMQIVFFD